MKSRSLLASLLLAAAFPVHSHAAEAAAGNSAIKPEPRDAKWVARHEGFLALTNKAAAKVLFLGDSITDGWRGKGKAVWEKNYAPLNAVNLGIGGDRTQHVLWRMDNGELEGLKPKAVVLMIGTNNSKGRNTPPEIIEGVTAVVKGLRTKLPQSKILLLAIFPRGQLGEPVRDELQTVNAAIAKLDDGKMVNFLDIGPKFLEANGVLSTNIMPDLLHPNEKGYEIWADAIKEPLAKLLK
jgi:lysophospholipase L1-like esterase